MLKPAESDDAGCRPPPAGGLVNRRDVLAASAAPPLVAAGAAPAGAADPPSAGTAPRAVEGAGARLHVAVTRGAARGAGARHPVVLLHGWPMTHHAWRRVSPLLAAAGHDVYAPDLPGLGASGPATAGHDTAAVAGDLDAALRAFDLGPVVLVGHDVGGWVAFAYAAARPAAVRALAVVETDVPGIGSWDEAWRDPKLWHFHFHGAEPPIAPTLVAGREREYLRYFHERDGRAPGAWGAGDLDLYAAAYAAPGRLDAGFAYYRALPANAERNRAAVAALGGALPMPALGVGGEHSLGAKVGRDLATVCPGAETAVLAGAGHFLPEERPDELARALLAFAAGRDAAPERRP